MREIARIAVISPGSFVVPSAHSSSVERIIERMIPLSVYREQTIIYGIRGEGLPRRGEVHGVHCVRVARGKGYTRVVMRAMAAQQPEVADVHNRPAIAWRIKKAFPRMRVLLTLHSTTFIKPPLISRRRLRAMLQSIDGIVVNSSFLRDEVLRLAPESQGRLFVNLPGVDPGDFARRGLPEMEVLREIRLQQLGWSSRRIILYTGRLIPGKGVHHLLHALPHVISQCPDVLLLIVGSPRYGRNMETAYLSTLRRQAAAMPGHVIFLPYTPHPALAELYMLAEIAVVPSCGEEAFGLVNVEAMATGIPVVASRIGGIPEVVRNGITGLLVEPTRMAEELAEAITFLLRNPHISRSMGMAGQLEVSERLLWKHAAERWDHVVQQMLAAKPPPGRRWTR
ncbi:Spore coat protein SA [compost metagenome]